MTIDFPQLVHDTLVNTYVQLRGEAPAGAFYPNDDVVEQLRAAFRSQPQEKLIRFLRDAMFAHMARTEITRTPFFVNSHLLAESSIAFMEKHRGYLRSFYGSGYEPRVFEQSVYGAVMASETDFLDLFGNCWLRKQEYPKWELIVPSVWWMIWSDTFQRLRRPQFPALWLEQRIMKDGNRTPAEQLMALERTRLADKYRYDAAERSAKEAMREAAITWAARHRAVRVLYEDGKSIIHPESPIQEDLLEASVPLHKRDEMLFEAVQKHGYKPPPRGINVEKTPWRDQYATPQLGTLVRDVGRNDDT